ncbi:hypothetical protein [Estrella lausannensis]|uniref:Uncharacterized protein n=1 Tax=Estrella lausannensis TaxID=483423 RepID=A0A0H5DQE6_9BACT|nr:hypothetical protein [Estrella lausannensis]CRX38293.1 hypothetical protein ELAC_0946 [Estrella lausannensis]
MIPIQNNVIHQVNPLLENLYTLREMKTIASMIRSGYHPGADSEILASVLSSLQNLFLNIGRCGEKNSLTIRNLWIQIASMRHEKPESPLEKLSGKIERAIQTWIRMQLRPERRLDHYLQQKIATQSTERTIDDLLENVLAQEEIILAEEEEALFKARVSASVRRRSPFCYDFAFYKLNEERATPFISEMASNQWPPEIFTHTHEVLNGWGYDALHSLVETAEGDLAVYFKREGTKLEARHFGVVSTMQGRILSKWGEVEAIFEHDFDKVPAAYGDFVAFFRKTNLSTSALRYAAP